VFEFIPITVACQQCGNNYEVAKDRDFSLICPQCQSTEITILTGKEIVLDNIEGES
jgi:Zn finger protein HypA/HybF involved in hydrogenase expression